MYDTRIRRYLKHPTVNRDSVVVVALAGVGILALALAGASITEFREGEGTGGGPAAEGPGPGLPEPGGPAADFNINSMIPTEVVLVLAFLVAVLVTIYTVRNIRDYYHYVIVVVLILAVLLVIFDFVPMDLSVEPVEENFEYEGVGESEKPGGGGGGGTPVIGDWFPVFLLLGGLLVVGVVASVLVRRRDEPPGGSDFEPSDQSTGHAADLGAAAGRAADRIGTETDTENEVYRAWREMIELLELGDPQSATPGAFARKAMAAGLAEEDVTDLTELFEQVRYGDRPVTTDRERAAVNTLRRIEERYAEGSS